MSIFKKLRMLFVLLICFVFVYGNTDAQRQVTVQPGFGTLANTIFGDTTSTGERVDPNTVYVLKRDGLYLLDGEFDPDFPVSIITEDGSGARRVIRLAFVTGGESPAQVIRPYANFYIKGAYLTASNNEYKVSDRIFRPEENGIRVVVEDCVLDTAGQAAFRINVPDTKIYLLNCVVSNIGTMASPDNGRVFDDRGKDIDSLVVVNNTMYNITSQVLRDDGGNINYVKFDHNTMVNVGQESVEIGEATEIVYTNNLLINPNFLGAANFAEYAVSILPPIDSTVIQTAVFSHNTTYSDPSIAAVYPDTVLAPIAYNNLAQSFIDAGGYGSTNLDEAVTFAKGLDSPAQSVSVYWSNPDVVPPGLDSLALADMDLSYATSFASYSGGLSGQPIGALTWFDMTVGVDKNENTAIPTGFALEQNYPNPFNPTTVIKYVLPSQSNVKLVVYNTLGQVVKTLVNSEQAGGSYSITWNGTNDYNQKVSSGIYLYKLSAGNFVTVKKMMLVK